MVDIGLRSGKLRAGIYQCNGAYIVKAPTGWWWVQAEINPASQLYWDQPFNTLTEAYIWCRQQKGWVTS